MKNHQADRILRKLEQEAVTLGASQSQFESRYVGVDEKGNPKTEWNGKYERIGYNQIGYNVDMTLQCGWDGNRKQFYTRIDANQATRFGGELAGTTWYGEDSGFANLALELFPDTEDQATELWGL